jgi:formyl-CoA transferase/CoA:oxalate CoA-transferase
MLAGGYGSMLLGDLGAEVIKIEPLEIGDRTRLLGPPFVEGESGYFLGINRNKKSVALDLKNEEGRQVLYDLVRVSDVVFDNFRPGVMEELGCGYETLREINPRIIYCTLSGFGEAGPYRDRPAFDLAIQAVSGAMSITGEPGRPSVRMGVTMGDLGGSLFCAFAISAALYAREKTGLGRKIDIALMDWQGAWPYGLGPRLGGALSGFSHQRHLHRGGCLCGKVLAGPVPGAGGRGTD